VRWNLVRRAENGLCYLDFVEFESGCSGATVFEQIRQLCLPQRKTLGYPVSSLLYSPVVYITTVVKVREFYSANFAWSDFRRDVTRPKAGTSKPSPLFMRCS
jgi:hypothetical protein